MPSPTYTALLGVVSSYTGAEKAKGLIDRQIEKGGANEDTLDKSHIKQLGVRISDCASLYIDDKRKQDECAKKIQSLAN